MLVSVVPQHFAFSSSTSSALRISTACQSRRPSSASSVVLTQPAGWRALTSEKRPWPPDSADLSPLDYYFRGFANAEVWRQKPTTIAALKAVVEGVAASLNGEVLRAVMRIERFPKLSGSLPLLRFTRADISNTLWYASRKAHYIKNVNQFAIQWYLARLFVINTARVIKV